VPRSWRYTTFDININPRLAELSTRHRRHGRRHAELVTPAIAPPRDVLIHADEVVASVDAQRHGRLVAAHLHGSAVLAGRIRVAAML
jgi:hypothetical protein